jgi:hypothetical protein
MDCVRVNESWYVSPETSVEFASGYEAFLFDPVIKKY